MTPLPLAVILAAGRGTRMRSARAKVLHPLLGRPMLAWVVEAVREAGLQPLLVLHHQEEAVRAAFPELPWRHQPAPRGTGDALRAVEDLLDGPVLVLPGDVPLLRPGPLRELLEAHRRSPGALCTLLSAELDDPGALGRVLRDAAGRPVGVVEHAEATPEQRALREFNTGVYCLDGAWLRERVLPALRPHPPKGELYLTDAVELAALEGGLRVLLQPDPGPFLGVNDRWALARAEELLQERLLRRWALEGVSFQRPATIRVEADVLFEPDVTVEPGAVLAGRTRVAAGARIGAGAVLVDTEVGPGARVLPYSHCEGAVIGAGVRAGPFARLRPGARLEEGSRVGNFVEVKNARLGPGAQANHLAYLGDAEIGEGSNIGAGTITCNYDGFRKHRSVLGRGVFVGSNTALVAPVRVGDGSIVAAGSTIVRDVPAGAVAKARARQENLSGRAEALRERLRRRAERGEEAP